MTMPHIHSPKPKIFGKGYGKHMSHNYVLMKKFFWLGWKMLVNMILPGAFYEQAHWEVTDLYYKMSGSRYGTNDPKRCEHCGSNLEPRETVKPHVIATIDLAAPATEKITEPALSDQPPTAAQEIQSNNEKE